MILTFTLKKKLDHTFAYLSDMQKFVLVHPIIFQIDEIRKGYYLIHETLKLGFLPLTFTYPVTIEQNRLANIIVFKALVLKFTKIEMTFTLQENLDFTVVEEEIQIKSPFPIRFFMERIFKAQHSLLFKNIELA
jgi:hypothetical protein